MSKRVHTRHKDEKPFLVRSTYHKNYRNWQYEMNLLWHVVCQELSCCHLFFGRLSVCPLTFTVSLTSPNSFFKWILLAHSFLRLPAHSFIKLPKIKRISSAAWERELNLKCTHSAAVGGRNKEDTTNIRGKSHGTFGIKKNLSENEPLNWDFSLLLSLFSPFFFGSS